MINLMMCRLQQFVNDILDDVSTTIVVISGDWQNVGPISNTAIGKLLNHSQVLPKSTQVWRREPIPSKDCSISLWIKGRWHAKTIHFLHINTNSLVASRIRISHFSTSLISSSLVHLGNGDGKRSSLPQLTTTDFFLEMAKSKYSSLLMATDQNAFVIMKRLDLDLCP